MDNKDPLDQFVTNLQREKEEELTNKKATELNLPYQNLVGYQPNPAAVVLIPKEVSNQGQVFAFEKIGNSISVAITDPANPETVSALKQISAQDEYEWKVFLVSKSSLAYLLSVYDTFAPTQTRQQDVEISQADIDKVSDIKNLSALQEALAQNNTTAGLELMLAGAIALEASDIHIEPEDKSVRIRYRLDGVLQDVADIPSAQLDPIINRIKLLSALKLNIHESAQDGRFSIETQSGTYDLRVSILPSQYGETIVMRLLPQKGKFISLEELGLEPKNLELINQAIATPNGLILNTGPTGSGKTTTLYAILAKLNQTERKIITVEDPIEYRLEGITQTQVNNEEDYTFANALRAIVRQDPDVVLVGEIRDEETADIAINASLTGHLVLSTLHTNDAAGAIPRLIDLQAKPAIFSDALRLIIAQRLIRKLCPECKKSHPPTEQDIANIKQISPTSPIPDEIHSAVGCPACNNTGYKGRVGIYELMSITPELKAKIVSGSPAHELTELAISQGMTTLGQDGISKVTSGTTDLTELLRVINILS